MMDRTLPGGSSYTDSLVSPPPPTDSIPQPTMNKRDLVEYLSEHLQTTKSSSEQIVNTVFQGIQEGLGKSGSVSIAGFGTWSSRQRAARTGRNPQTGDTIQIPASTTVAFKPAKAWKDRLNGRG